MPLSICHAKGLYMLDGGTFADRRLPNRAGFRWHDPGKCKISPCPACLARMPAKRWWTDDEGRVVALARILAEAGQPPLDFGDDRLAERVAAAVGTALTEEAQRQHWLDELDYKGDDREGE